MSESLSARMRRGEAAMAEASPAPISATTVVGAVRRRRAWRASAASGVAVAVVAAVAWSAVTWMPEEQTVPAVTPTRGTPTPTSESASSTPADSDGTLPVLVPASQEEADRLIDPSTGPTFEVGAVRPASQVAGDVAASSCVDELCGRVDLPAVDVDSLDRDSPTTIMATTAWATGEGDPGYPLVSLVLASPVGFAATAVDVSAWAQDAGWGPVSVDDVAGEGTRIVAAVRRVDDNTSGIVMWDLATGDSVVLASGLESASVEWDGSAWLVYGVAVDDTLGASVSADATEWTTEGVEVAPGSVVSHTQEGPVLLFPGSADSWRILDGDVYPAVPADQTDCRGGVSSPGQPALRCRDSESGRWWGFALVPGDGWVALVDLGAQGEGEGTLPPIDSAFAPLGGGYLVAHEGGFDWLVRDEVRPVDAPQAQPMRGVSGTREWVWVVSPDGVGVVDNFPLYSRVIAHDMTQLSVEQYRFGFNADIAW